MSGRVISKMECKKLNQTILKMWEEFDFPEKLTIDDKNRLKNSRITPMLYLCGSKMILFFICVTKR